jgi:hypothetical protein
MQPQPVYVGVGQFDAGARFDSTSTANVPVCKKELCIVVSVYYVP